MGMAWCSVVAASRRGWGIPMHHLSVSISVASGAYTYFRAFIAAATSSAALGVASDAVPPITQRDEMSR
ncbi:hypothetical protein K0M31_015740 [Melipona bicolor]|uniref:Uncharacterized protein n=1 Tax=Melipona bicolor TaxID=60889 RepID=A0AA40FF01_9HYME|nr:hypothetical protein K0M31_015740 [Melipona bicolor]